MQKRNGGQYTVFFDFDNTITTIDVIDDMLSRFSQGDGWRELEERWQREEIGSRECLQGQVEGMRIEKNELDRYLDGIKIDPYFKKLIRLFGSRGIETVIVSDNFDYMLGRVLKNNGIPDIGVYCNKIEFDGSAPKTSFPHSNKECGDCANCKKTRVLSMKKPGYESVYIGDGRSDVCAARVSDKVFAKDHLKEVFEKEKRPHIAIGSLKDVYDYFKGAQDE